MPKQKAIDLADQVLSYATHKGIMHLYTQNETLNGRMIEVNNSELINFGSCSYLGLEREPRVIDACAQAAYRYGTQFSSSRAYMSTSQYLELEALFTQLFSTPCLVTPTTSLGHLAALPALVRPGELVVLDHQVHASVFQASRLLKAQGEQVEMIRHNDLDRLETLIRQHRQTQRRIWYCIDGVYSMYGDLAPMDELYQLMDRYPEFYIYADDAHGMSWYGQKGRGTIRGFRDHHAQLVMAVSLNKAFGCAGGLLVFPNMEMKQRVRTCGGPLVFSGPIQPPMLGAAIASARLHLSGEVEHLQQRLMAKIKHCQQLIKAVGLPDVADSDSPVFFIGTGEINAGINLIHRLHLDGFYVNAGIFPAVPIHNMGVRFTLTNHVSEADITGLIERMAYHYPLALAEENVSSVEVANAFALKDPLRSDFIGRYAGITNRRFNIHLYDSVNDVKAQWQQVPNFHGSVAYENLAMLEATFAVKEAAEVDHEHWKFCYLVITDSDQRAVVMAVLTLCDIKTDMFASKDLSLIAEEQRRHNPGSFVSRALMLGTPITEGEHLYIDPDSSHPVEALKEFLKQVKALQLEFDAELLSLRDFQKSDWRVKCMADEGFLIQSLPATHILTRTRDFGEHSFLEALNQKHRANWRKQILPYIGHYQVAVIELVTEEMLDCFYQLYRSVQENAREISSFPLPKAFFQAALETGLWRCLGLRHEGEWAGCVFFMVQGEQMYPMVIGMNSALKPLGIYRACLYAIGRYAKDEGLGKVYLGFTASVEKRRIGAQAIETVAMVRMTNTYQVESLEALSLGTRQIH